MPKKMMAMMTTTLSDLTEFVESQLSGWPEAKARYEALGLTERRIERYGEWPLIVQHNPARAVSTEARTDAASIAARPCFLCSSNRPEEQKAIDWPEDWQLLVNPFPVLPLHFVGASRSHQPQSALPLAAIEAALAFPGLVAFFNGAKAGASAPDHLHYQAVLASELPLLGHIEKLHRSFGSAFSDELDPALPVKFISVLASPDDDELMWKVMNARGRNAETGLPDPDMVNTFVWTDGEGLLRALVFRAPVIAPPASLRRGRSGLRLVRERLIWLGSLSCRVQRIMPGLTAPALRKSIGKCSLPLPI